MDYGVDYGILKEMSKTIFTLQHLSCNTVWNASVCCTQRFCSPLQSPFHCSVNILIQTPIMWCSQTFHYISLHCMETLYFSNRSVMTGTNVQKQSCSPTYQKRSNLGVRMAWKRVQYRNINLGTGALQSKYLDQQSVKHDYYNYDCSTLFFGFGLISSGLKGDVHGKTL